MSSTKKFNPEDLDPTVLGQVLEPLSDYYISKRRLKIHETMLGRGGFGTVKLAELWPTIWIPLVSLPVTVAVKELRLENHDGGPLRIAVRLAREIKVWASCQHFNILEFTGYYLSKNYRTAYLVSPYMANGNIKDYLSRRTLSQKRRLELVFGTIKGLAYLHSRSPPVVHGDLKSLNVLVNNEGEALLSDFGLAKAMEDKPTGLSTSNGFKGTPRYCSPEVLNGSPRDCPSDIWSWGCLALEIITGHPPYHEATTEAQVLILICGPEDHRKTPEPSDISSLPSTALTLLKMCWSFEPGQRPRAQQCVDDIQTLVRVNYSRYASQRPRRAWLSIGPDINEGNEMERKHPHPVTFLPGQTGIIGRSALGLPEHLFIPSTGLDFSMRLGDLAHGIAIASLSLQDKDEKVMVKHIKISDQRHLERVADEFNQKWALKHENLLEITGYSLSSDSKRFCVVWRYTRQSSLLEYLCQNNDLTLGARLTLLKDMLNGLVYLHSSSVSVAPGDLNPWTVFVNDEGKAVLSLIGAFVGPTNMIGNRRSDILWRSSDLLSGDNVTSKSDIWSWACIVLQVMCGIRQFDGVPIHNSKFMTPEVIVSNVEPYPTPKLPYRLLGLVRKCWRENPDDRPSASDCLGVLDLVIQDPAIQDPVIQDPAIQEGSDLVEESHGTGVRKCWREKPDDRPSASDCLGVLDLVIPDPVIEDPAIQDPAIQDPAIQEDSDLVDESHGTGVWVTVSRKTSFHS